MSAAREVAGLRPTIGRRRRVPYTSPGLSRSELEQFRCALHDFAADRGARIRRVQKPNFSRNGSPLKTTAPPRFWRRDWSAAIVASVRRTGSLLDAALLVGVDPANVQARFAKDQAFQERCKDALSKFTARREARAQRIGAVAARAPGGLFPAYQPPPEALVNVLAEAESPIAA
jgi:hypothetical protein